MRGASSVLCISDGVAELGGPPGVADSRIVVVGNGVDTDVFTPDGPSLRAPGRRVGEDAGPVFVYTGTMSEWQGAEVLVRALAVLRATEPTARLVFLGQGSDVPTCAGSRR